MTKGRFVLGAAVAAVVGTLPHAAHGQMDGRVVITPYVGVYAPSTDMFRFGLVQNGTTVSFNTRHEPAAAVGASASVWLDQRFAIEVGGLYSRNTLRADLLMNQVGTVTSSHSSGEADVWAGTLKLMVQALPPQSGLNLRVGVGPAIITRGGPAYRSVAEGRMVGLTDLGGALSLCSRLAIGGNADIRVRVEDLVYSAKQTWESASLAGATLASEPHIQHDFVLSLGLQFTVAR